METQTSFKEFLDKTNLARNTVTSYLWTVEYYFKHYGTINKKNLLAYKGFLIENYKPQTVNLRLQGLNKYLEFTKQEKLKVRFVKVQQKNFWRANRQNWLDNGKNKAKRKNVTR